MKDQTSARTKVPLAGRLAGRTAVITGGANGIGRAAVRMFAEAGARVAVLDIAAEAGRAVEAEQRALGREVMFVQADVTQSATVRAALAQVTAAWGPVDTLFSHAGTIIVKPLHQTTDEDYDRLMAINVRSSFIVCREVVAQMRETGGGSIVLTSSIGGEIPRRRHPRQRRLPRLRENRPRAARDRRAGRAGPELEREQP
jgi:NAD(P)-dependent dehydrogenase (short-subunit alcohol dehydrogenase family)